MGKTNTFGKQTKILISKNLKSIRRNKSYLCFLFITPMIAIFFTWMTDRIVKDALESYTKKDFPIEKIGKIPKCRIGKNKNNCVTLGYYVFGQTEEYMNDVMKNLAEKNDLKYGTDVKHLGSGNVEKYKKLISEKKNETQTVVIFCNSQWDVKINTQPLADKSTGKKKNNFFRNFSKSKK